MCIPSQPELACDSKFTLDLNYIVNSERELEISFLPVRTGSEHGKPMARC